ncbi:MAG TPA: TetR/AcrR family transcriptional regulator [Gemmatimonadaceae bacterium]|nr:TetR/AcrR family transcriptional regulator [Gemmatimonadaceae bacterium]
MDVREKLLKAAADVYAESGYRGATTRRIAHEAGVNEITLFRHFGSKDALLNQALHCCGLHTALAALPHEPRDPERELTEWSRDFIDHMYRNRSMIRTCLGEIESHPEVIPNAAEGPAMASRELCEYLVRLRERGMAGDHFDPSVAAATLMGAMFADAMGRDLMPDMYRYPAEDAAALYVKLFLHAIEAG